MKSDWSKGLQAEKKRKKEITYYFPCFALGGSDGLLSVAKGGVWPDSFLFKRQQRYDRVRCCITTAAS